MPQPISKYLPFLQRIPAYLTYLLMTGALLWLSQLTRFENRITIKVTGSAITAKSHGNILHSSLDKLRDLSIRFHGTAIGQIGIKGLTVRSGEQVLTYWDLPVFYFWGRDWLGNLATGGAPPLAEGYFGDWIDPRPVGQDIPLMAGNTLDSLSIQLDVVGPGYFELAFAGDRDKVTYSLSDGTIDNAAGFSTGESSFSFEPLSTNVARIANFFCEGFAIAFLLLAILAIFSKSESSPPQQSKEQPAANSAIGAGIAILHFGICVWFSKWILDGIPHIPDSATYYRQALLLSHGMIFADLPPVSYYLPFLGGGARLTAYGIGYFHAHHFWPFLLAPFIFLKIPFLLNPLLSALSCFLVFRLTNKYFGKISAILAATFFAFSPLAICMAGDYMMHTATLALMLGSICFLDRAIALDNGRSSALAGVSAGYAFGIRQLTVLTCLPSFAIAVALPVLKARKFRHFAFFILGAAPLLFLLGLNNYFVTGSFFRSVHEYLWGLTLSPSNLPNAMNFMNSYLNALPPKLFPGAFPHVLLGLGFLGILIHPRAGLVVFAAFLLEIAGHSFLDTNCMHAYGPRFIFEGAVGLFVLAAFSCQYLFRALPQKMRPACLAILFTFLVVDNSRALLAGLPNYMQYNGINGNVMRTIRDTVIPKSAVLLDDGSWQHMGVVATIFDPHFKNLLFVREMADKKYLPVVRELLDQGYTLFEVQGTQVVRCAKEIFLSEGHCTELPPAAYPGGTEGS